MLKLYGAPNTRAVRIVWLLEELALPYELILLEFQTTSTEFFIQQTPTGKIPTLEDVPELLPYLSRLQARSAFQAAIAKLNATAPTDR